MTEVRIPQELGNVEGEGRPKRCPVCGRSSSEVALVMPEKLAYRDAKAYAGPMFCLTCVPRFLDAERLDFGRVS